MVTVARLAARRPDQTRPAPAVHQRQLAFGGDRGAGRPAVPGRESCLCRPTAGGGPTRPQRGPPASRPARAPDDQARYGGGPYADAEPGDDFYWAAAELWLATGEHGYREQVLESAWHNADPVDLGGFDFDRVAIPARLDLALLGHFSARPRAGGGQGGGASGPAARLAGSPAVGPAVRSNRRLGLGVERPFAQQSGGPGRFAPAHLGGVGSPTP
jgi:hypothetical protein